MLQTSIVLCISNDFEIGDTDEFVNRSFVALDSSLEDEAWTPNQCCYPCRSTLHRDNGTQPRRELVQRSGRDDKIDLLWCWLLRRWRGYQKSNMTDIEGLYVWLQINGANVVSWIGLGAERGYFGFRKFRILWVKKLRWCHPLTSNQQTTTIHLQSKQRGANDASKDIRNEECQHANFNGSLVWVSTDIRLWASR